MIGRIKTGREARLLSLGDPASAKGKGYGYGYGYGNGNGNGNGNGDGDGDDGGPICNIMKNIARSL